MELSTFHVSIITSAEEGQAIFLGSGRMNSPDELWASLKAAAKAPPLAPKTLPVQSLSEAIAAWCAKGNQMKILPPPAESRAPEKSAKPKKWATPKISAMPKHAESTLSLEDLGL